MYSDPIFSSILWARSSNRVYRPTKAKIHGEIGLTAQENPFSWVELQLISGSFNKSGYNPLKTRQKDVSFLPVEGYRKIVLPFNADVWVPLVQGLRVLLKHPLVPSGNAAWTQIHGHKTLETFEQATAMPLTQGCILNLALRSDTCKFLFYLHMFFLKH